MPKPSADASSNTVKAKNATRDLWISGVVAGFVVLALAVVVWYAVLRYVGNNIRSTDFSGVTAKVNEIGAQVEWIRKIANSGAFPSRRIDHTSVGAPLVENKLIEVSRASRLYESVYHRLPADLEELDRFGLPESWQEGLKKLEKECQIDSLAPHSAILNCDSWARPSEDKLNTLVRSFDPHTERFYEIDGHVLLYIPPFTIGIAILGDRHE